jgi:hypothetical protein
MMCRRGQPLSALIAERQRRFPVSGEINRQVGDPDGVLARVEARFKPGALAADYTDGLSLEFADWRVNLRKSNTEPVLRLNVETRGDRGLVRPPALPCPNPASFLPFPELRPALFGASAGIRDNGTCGHYRASGHGRLFCACSCLF